ncbi:hypothetical protein GCM10009678_19470 [Actinomadura kijaniata]
MIVSIGCAGHAIGWRPIPDPGDEPALTSDSSGTVWETTQFGRRRERSGPKPVTMSSDGDRRQRR